MELIDILSLTIGWLLISCAIARVLGGACDLGVTHLAQWNDVTTVGDPPRLADEDYCLGLVLERVGLPSSTIFPALFFHVPSLGGVAIPSARVAQGTSRQTPAEQGVALESGLTPAR